MKKKEMIILAHENHDKWPNVTPDHHFCRGFDHSNHVNIFRGSKYLLKNLNISDSVLCIFFLINMSTWNGLFEKIIIFSPICGTLGIGHNFRNGSDRCLL